MAAMLPSKTGITPHASLNTTAWLHLSSRQLLDCLINSLLPPFVLSKLRRAEIIKLLLENILKSPPMLAKTGLITNDALGVKHMVEDFGPSASIEVLPAAKNV